MDEEEGHFWWDKSLDWFYQNKKERKNKIHVSADILTAANSLNQIGRKMMKRWERKGESRVDKLVYNLPYTEKYIWWRTLA